MDQDILNTAADTCHTPNSEPSLVSDTRSIDLGPTASPAIRTLFTQYHTGHPQLGDGVVMEVLGSGGMAVVFKTWCEKLERFHAVKILRPDADESLRRRFSTEAKITGQLNHRYIAEILSVGEWQGLPFIEMKYIDGVSLDAIIRKHTRLPLCVICSIAIQIAEALIYIHTMRFQLNGKFHEGIIHRDLKTANILISKSGELKVIDFGVARPVEGGIHTTDGRIVGTLQYLPPEQLREDDSIDTRTDIYSLGEVLYEMATGEKTFPQITCREIIEKKATNSYKKLGEFDTPTDIRLQRIIEKCLENRPELRFSDATDLQKALYGILQTETNKSAEEVLKLFIVNPFGFVELLQKPRTNQPLIAGIITGCAVVLVVVGLFILRNHFSAQERHIDVSQRRPSVGVTVRDANRDGIAETPTVESLVTEKKPVAEGSMHDTIPTVETRPPASATQATPTVSVHSVRTNKTPTGEGATKNQGGGPMIGQLQAAQQTESKTGGITIPADPFIEPKTGAKSVAQPGGPSLPHGTYAETDPVDAGFTACRAGAYGKAVSLLEKVKPDHPRQSLRNLLLMWGYIETRRFADAAWLASSLPLTDGYSFILLGKLDAARGLEDEADKNLFRALTVPSDILPFARLRSEVLIASARVRDVRYGKDPSGRNRYEALTAWENLLDLYRDMPRDPLYLQARQRVAALTDSFADSTVTRN